jgi:hypothetical protein
MPPRPLHRTIDRVSRRVPGLKRLPVLRLLALGEVAILAQQHFTRLTPQERRRLVELVRLGRGRRQNLTLREREELSELVAKAAPREFAAQAVQKLSPVPIPDPVVRRFGQD